VERLDDWRKGRRKWAGACRNPATSSASDRQTKADVGFARFNPGDVEAGISTGVSLPDAYLALNNRRAAIDEPRALRQDRLGVQSGGREESFALLLAKPGVPADGRGGGFDRWKLYRSHSHPRETCITVWANSLVRFFLGPRNNIDGDIASTSAVLGRGKPDESRQEQPAFHSAERQAALRVRQLRVTAARRAWSRRDTHRIAS